jgi:hypothetical protein
MIDVSSELYYDIRDLKTFAKLALGEQPWFIESNWDGNDVHIINSNNERLFSIDGGIHLATYICMMNNKLSILINEVEKKYEYR